MRDLTVAKSWVGAGLVDPSRWRFHPVWQSGHVYSVSSIG